MALNADDAPFGEILGGHFSPDFIVFQIRNDRETFLQIHTSKQQLAVVGAIDNNVVNF